MSTATPHPSYPKPAEISEGAPASSLLLGSALYYRYIAIVLFVAFIIEVAALVVLHVRPVQIALSEILGLRAILALELYFWAALGATIASYKFFADDKELNEIEAVKRHPNPKVLRYPNALDVVLYVQRIVFNGVLGVVGGLIVMAGLGYFDVQLSAISEKQRMFFIVVAFLIGVYQNEFLTFLMDLNRKILLKKEPAKDKNTGEAG
jgi:hypothetical protein